MEEKLSHYELIYNPLRFGLLRILGFSQHTIAHGVYVVLTVLVKPQIFHVGTIGN